MLEIFQQTISTPITFEGIGLHTGKKTKITIHRGLENQGIVFRRTDIKKNNLSAKSRYRPEIDGLRAFAVVAVIINHFNKDILPGGYLGVDIFLLFQDM